MVRSIFMQALPLCQRAIEDIGDKWEVVSDSDGKPFVEYEFITPVTKDVVFKAKIDLLIRERSTGMLWLVDFKVRSDISELDPMDFDMQMATYQYLLKIRGIHTTGSLIYQIRSKMPQAPSLNKDGTMSRNKSITTDWPTYKAALIEAGLNPADYADMMVAFSQRKFTREDRVYRGEDTLINYWRNTSITIRSLIADRKRLSDEFENGLEAPRSISPFNCARCSVQQFCMTEFEDQPTDMLMGLAFERKEDK